MQYCVMIKADVDAHACTSPAFYVVLAGCRPAGWSRRLVLAPPSHGAQHLENTTMQAFSFEELKSFLDSTGVPVHEALEVGDDFKDWPDPETFEENLTVHGIDKTPLKFLLPDVSDVEIAGLEEVKEELVSFPPYMDIKGLLKPIHIPAAYLPKDTPQPPSGAIRQEPITSTSQSTPRSISSQETSSPSQLPVKREREWLSSHETEPQRKKTTVTDNSNQTQSSPIDQDVSISNSIEIVDPESEDDSVIDLTQDT